MLVNKVGGTKMAFPLFYLDNSHVNCMCTEVFLEKCFYSFLLLIIIFSGLDENNVDFYQSKIV